jgi:purine-binding chemotaxis protein CheW
MSLASTPPPTPDAEDDTPSGPQWVVVHCAEQSYGIPVEQVREVVRAEGIVTVPGAPAVQVGIVNVRGAIVTVLDLAALLTGARAVAPASIVLLEQTLRTTGTTTPIGITVDAVQDVRHATADSEATPILPLNALALLAGHLHSAEERER